MISSFLLQDIPKHDTHRFEVREAFKRTLLPGFRPYFSCILRISPKKMLPAALPGGAPGAFLRRATDAGPLPNAQLPTPTLRERRRQRPTTYLVYTTQEIITCPKNNPQLRYSILFTVRTTRQLDHYEVICTPPHRLESTNIMLLRSCLARALLICVVCAVPRNRNQALRRC